MIAIEESLSQPCEINIFPSVTHLNQKERVDTLKVEYIKSLSVIGKCELQRKESLKTTKELKKLYNN